MSLINEALKRTRDASYQPVSTAPAAVPGYRVQNEVESRGSKSTMLIIIVVAAVAVAGVVGLASHFTTRIQSVRNSFSPGADATPAVPEKAPPGYPAGAAPIPVPSAKVEAPQAETQPPAPAVDTKSREDQLVARVVEKIKADQAAAVPAAPEPPKLVLQGITSAKDGSEAMINGLTVREGDEIESARVVSIDRRAVKLDCNGREVVLRLP